MGALFEKPAFLVLILLVLLLFGAKRLPDLARGVGRSLRIFKSETEGLRGESGTTADAAAAPAAPVAAAPVAPAVAPAPAAPDAPRYLVDPITGEKILAQPVTPPADGAPRV
jgi:sec-independent protein translocase protein TatA